MTRKINVDVEVDDALGFIGIGAAARDYRGVVLGALSRRMMGLFSPHVGEYLAGREGAWFALSRGFSKWIIETDVINILKAVSFLTQCFIEANVIDDIRNSLSYSGIGSVCYRSRERNSVIYFSYMYYPNFWISF